MPSEPALILEIPLGGAVDRQVSAQVPPAVAAGEIVVDRGPTDAEGNLEAAGAGQVVLSVPSPEALRREPEEASRVIARAGEGVEPLVIVVEAAEQLREDELASVLEAARRSRRSVILRVIRDG